MKITFISLFPEMFDTFSSFSIIKKAVNFEKVTIESVNIRDFANNNDVDDYIYGGGPGMLMKIEPIVKALESVKKQDSFVILTSPKGKIHNQKNAKKLAKKKHIIFICGHYEGIDARIYQYIDQEISIGQFIVTGGEIIAEIIADSIIRLIPGVINDDSIIEESFEDQELLIECDHYTKPRVFRDQNVPEILLNGNHKEIEMWRKNSAKKNTKIFWQNQQEN